MAIKKSIETKMGVNAEYWTINEIHIFGREKLTARGQIYGYLNKEAYDNGAKELDKIYFNVTGFTKEDILSYKGIYEFVLATVEKLKDGEEI